MYVYLQQRYKLKGCSIISKIIASLLLVLLMLSITPKTFLHDILADHQDVQFCNDEEVNGPCIHNQGFNCQQADIVVPLTYQAPTLLVIPPVAMPHVSHADYISFSALLAPQHSSFLRGPPARV